MSRTQRTRSKEFLKLIFSVSCWFLLLIIFFFLHSYQFSQNKKLLIANRLGKDTEKSLEQNFGQKQNFLLDDNGNVLIDECTNYSRHVVFWKYIEKDYSHKSPFFVQNYTQFLFFQPDEGGWNNLRIGFEANLALAYATGRTLVLPPRGKIYLLNKDSLGNSVLRKNQKPQYRFSDIFNLKHLRLKMEVLEMSQFILLANSRNLLSIPKPAISLVQQAETDEVESSAELWKWIESFSFTPRWDPSKQFIGFFENSTTKEARNILKPYQKRGRQMIPYDMKLQREISLYFPQCRGQPCRMLIQFYSWLAFGVSHRELDRQTKRLFRDNLHYNSVILCTAARIIERLKLEGDGKYSSAHVRRNDFQYETARHAPLEEIKDVLWRNIGSQDEVLYLATDEQKHVFFTDLEDRFKIRLLSDFEDITRDIDPNFLGMIEQIVCAEARVFIGTWWSTFTAYIHRIRGYKGLDEQSFFYPKSYEKEMLRFQYPEGLGWWREWPSAWKYEKEAL